jgi:hypothetical protein
VLGILVLVGLAIALPAWKVWVDRRLYASWRKSLGGASFVERYPETEDDSSVRDLNRLAAAIGIEMAPPDTLVGHIRPDAEAVARFAAVKKPLSELLSPSNCPTDGLLASPAPAPKPTSIPRRALGTWKRSLSRWSQNRTWGT